MSGRIGLSKDIGRELKELASILLRLGCFEKQVTINLCRSASKMAKRRRIDPERIFFRSLRQSRGRVYLVCKNKRDELLVCFDNRSVSKGNPPAVFSNARRTDMGIGNGTQIATYVTPFTNENLLELIEEEFPGLSPRSMRATPRLGLGVRMLFTLPPFLHALETVSCLADFQLSAGREFSLREVVEAAPGKYPEWLGHTGLDAATLYGTIARNCFKFGRSVYGAEIDHAIVTPEPSTTISRIRSSAQDRLQAATDKASIEDSMIYNYRIIEEATRTGFVAGITTDTSSLFREEVDEITKWPKERLRAEYEAVVPAGERNNLEESCHPGTPLVISDPATKHTLELTFTQEELMRLAVKFWDSLLANKRLHEHMTTAMKGKPFTFEISLDEAYRTLTTEKELFFYLLQSDRMGMKADLIAPNVGFRKREDYQADLTELEHRVSNLAAVAAHFGAILDFHSGSDKRLEVYRTISRATNGKLKLKMAGIFQLLYFETLASFGQRTEERRLFERMWKYTLSYAEKAASEGDDAAVRMLREARVRAKSARKARTKFTGGPRDEFFRHYSFITVAAKNKLGRHIFRNKLYKIAQKPEVAEKYNRKAFELTVKVAKALGLEKTDDLLAPLP